MIIGNTPSLPRGLTLIYRNLKCICEEVRCWILDCDAHAPCCFSLQTSELGLPDFCHYLLQGGPFLKKILFIDLYVERGERREKERERNIHVWLPLMHPVLGTWPTTQACALTGNRTGDSLVLRPAVNPQSHASQGRLGFWMGFFSPGLTISIMIPLGSKRKHQKFYNIFKDTFKKKMIF